MTNPPNLTKSLKTANCNMGDSADTEYVIDPENYGPVQIDGSVVDEEGYIFLQSLKDGTVFRIPFTAELREMFHIEDQIDQRIVALSDDVPTCVNGSACATTSARPHAAPVSHSTRAWAHTDILALIASVKEHQPEFKSTTIKNDAVWKKISEEMVAEAKNFTPTQCKDKYKYLKGKYIKKKDNMSARSSGAETVTFKYFDELDEFLGHSHNANPIALASNLNKQNVPGEILLEDDDDGRKHGERKRKLDAKHHKQENAASKALKDITALVATRDDAAEKRHKETLESRQQAMAMFCSKMDDLIGVIAKRK